MKLYLGDCIEILRTLASNSVDSIVTDPPYGFAFMGKKWDYEIPSVEMWKEALRVLKPGGHLLAFGGPRTYHRLACNIEDAGFEIRDQLQWLFGSGFPKSLDISKAIDKAAGVERETFEVPRNGGPGGKSAHIGQISNERKSGIGLSSLPATDAAKQWSGWGTALKPANEPILLARKPLSEPTVAKNVLRWGTGGLNIDASRIGVSESDPNHRVATGENGAADSMFGVGNSKRPATLTQGRFPANLLLDEVAAEMLDEQSGGCPSKSGGSAPRSGHWGNSGKGVAVRRNDSGGASRFFYCAKTSKSERNAGLEGMPEVKMQDYAEGTKRKLCAQAEGPKNPNLPRQNFHPTVKPIKLMQYLINLITPPKGIVLDPFMGSGSTGVAAKKLALNFIGIEKEKEYYEIARRRINLRDMCEYEK